MCLGIYKAIQPQAEGAASDRVEGGGEMLKTSSCCLWGRDLDTEAGSWGRMEVTFYSTHFLLFTLFWFFFFFFTTYMLLTLKHSSQ